jgi:hypothetical protein
LAVIVRDRDIEFSIAIEVCERKACQMRSAGLYVLPGLELNGLRGQRRNAT